MKRIYFACLFLCLTTTILLSQSNPVPLFNQTAGVVAPISASQRPRFRADGGHEVSVQTQGLNLAPAAIYDSGGYDAFSVTVADVNRDGKPDLLVANWCANGNGNTCNGTVGVLLGNGDGTFQTAVSYGSGGWYAWSVVVGDVNGDGKPDVLVLNACADSNCATGSVGVLLGNGDGTFQTAVSYGSGGREALSLAVADVNGDGKPDLLVGNNFSGTVGVLLGKGDGTFQTTVTYGAGGSLSRLSTVADVNGDGKPDLLVINDCDSSGDCYVNGTVGVLLGKGDGTFQTAVSYPTGGYTSSANLADVNGDGKPDILAVNACATYSNGCVDDGTVGVLLGNGDGTFQTVVSYGSGGFDA